jgi:hypothetical protein
MFGALACGPAHGNGKDDKGAVVDLDGLRSQTPPEWKEEKPATKLRLTQFRLPKAKDDKADAELAIFQNAGGSVADNVKRWKAQFRAPEGKEIDDVAKVTEIKIAGRDATLLELTGTYNAPPFDPTFKGANPDFRLVAIQFKGPENLYHIKLTGPAATVEHHRKAFDDWIKGFK